MKNLISIRNSLRDIALILAQDERIQKLLLVDQYDVEAETFEPLSLDQMLQQKYICLTPQNENAIRDLGRNTFIIITLQDIAVNSSEDNMSVLSRIFVITDIDHAMIKNYQDRTLLLADYILQDLNEVKLSSAGEIKVTYVTRVAYNELLSGYQITLRYTDQETVIAEI